MKDGVCCQLALARRVDAMVQEGSCRLQTVKLIEVF